MSSSDSEDRPLLQDGGGSGSKPPGHKKHGSYTTVVPISLADEMRTSDNEYISQMPRTQRRSSRLSNAFQDSGQHNVALSWRDLCVTVHIPGKRSFFSREVQPPQDKMILKNITGIASPGCLLAILGASGSGKSTLLNVLTSRNIKDYVIQGEVQLNGVPISGTGIRNISAYVQQSDIFIGSLTVRETLRFRALLRMDKKLNNRARLARVEEVIKEMGLSNCSDSRIGEAAGNKKGISGGERKRLAFASEALTNPPIFFCDEPTSSLDTFMAQSIVQTLQKMASRGRVILCTIHQPSSELFAMFNQVLLLSEGRVAYMGPSNGAIDFFNKLHFPCPQNFNPADHYILTLAIVPGQENECRKKDKEICDAFEQSHWSHSMRDQIDEYVRQSDMADHIVLDKITGDTRYESPMIVQYLQLFWRAWTHQYRDKMLFATRITQTLFMAVILGLVYLDLTIDQKGVMDINGGLFILVTNVSFTNMFAVLTSFPEEMGIVMREYGTGLYRVDTYFLTKTISEIPMLAGSTIMFMAVTYWMMGLNDTFEAFMIACGVSILAGMVSVNVGYLLSVITGDTTLALSVASPVLIPFMIFGGPFMNGDSTPDYFVWLEKISWFSYSFEVLMVNQWDDIDSIACENTTSGLLPNMSMLCPGSNCLYRTGKDVLAYNSFDKDDVAQDLAILGGLLAGVYFITFFFLILRARRSRE